MAGKNGRRPASNAQKIAKGERRPGRMLENVIEFPKTLEVPAPPKHLTGAGREMWLEVAPIYHAQGVLTKPDIYALAHLCDTHGKVIDTYYSEGLLCPPVILGQLRLMFAEFGMTPSSRTKVGAPQKKDGNKFGQNGNKENK